MNNRNLQLDPDEYIRLERFVSASEDPPEITISAHLQEILRDSPVLVQEILARGQQIYGISTGFGPLASHPGASTQKTHQQNLIAHLATGTGPALPPRVVRAALMDRLITLSRGRSAASPELLEMLIACLNARVEPEIPAYGSVGASGDLTPMAHVALALAGEGRFLQGPAQQVLSILELSPLDFSGRDALALVNGTSASTALAALAWWDVASILPVLLVGSGMMITALQLPRGAYADSLHSVRLHPGQIAIASALRTLLPGSEPSREPGNGDNSHERSLQAAYSFRCIPQILGPQLEALTHAGIALEREVNAVTDNPIFDPESRTVLHGGNFHGHILAQACDALTLAMANCAVLMDRQIARITDPALNQGLPPFLSPRQIGANSGLMGAQVSATALTAELSAVAGSRYMLESRSTNGANQDVVSMSTLAAHRLYQAAPRFRELLAIHLIAAAQAWELTREQGNQGTSEAIMLDTLRWVRNFSPSITTDRPLYADINTLAEHLSGDAFPGRETRPWDPLWNALFPEFTR